MDEENIIEDYEDTDYITDVVEDITIIPSSDIPDSIEFYKNYSNHSKQKITDPCLTKYEKTKILGIRLKQLNNGSLPYVKVKENILDNFIIAKIELKQKKLPFIIQRPLPNNTFEYWKLEDLEIL